MGRAQHELLSILAPEHPSDEALAQLREAFPNPGQYKYAILDRDSKLGGGGRCTGRLGHEAGAQQCRESVANGIAERWAETARRDCSIT